MSLSSLVLKIKKGKRKGGARSIGYYLSDLSISNYSEFETRSTRIRIYLNELQILNKLSSPIKFLLTIFIVALSESY